MSVLIDPQVVAAAITVLLTALAAGLGFLLRERLARLKPFIACTAVDGDVRSADKKVVVPATVASALAKSTIFSDLLELSEISDVEDELDRSARLRETGPRLADISKNFRVAAANQELGTCQTLLGALLSDGDLDHWITVLIGETVVAVPDVDASLPKLIPCTYQQKSNGGAFAIGLPGDGTYLGKSFETFELYKQNVARFVALIERMELSKLSDVLDRLAASVTEAVSIAKDVHPLLQSIVDKNSQWTMRIYLANLSSAPLLVQTSATLKILDKSGAKYSEPLELIVLKSDSEGRQNRYRSNSPLIVRGEADQTFEFATQSTQERMESGEAIRLAFNSGTATCHIEFAVDRPGLLRRQTLTSPKVKFVET